MNIGTMEERHIAALAEIERQCFSAPWSEKALSEELNSDKSLFLVAEEGDTVLGYVGCQTVLDEGYITNVAVHPAARRRGVARMLLQSLQETALQRGLTFVTLEVRVSNAAAIALYENAGYVPVGTRKGFYQNPKEDALLMTLFLSHAGEMENINT